ncbi:hypothetical protein AK812_SmicGene46318 [Symbiodinium microadriaticum]|uniref:Uncharacterized protein n=1 Tax=Symbiodinium microadriaticum TaxID=2951 RepID=A0A1Q9BUD2_SYMMI|nr:hypothetical protein AK812_SmicGene46318 [Symbiodinium microadriaticum]
MVGEHLKGEVSLEHVLSHRAGLWQPLPDDIRDASQLLDAATVASAWRKAAPREDPGSVQRSLAEVGRW